MSTIRDYDERRRVQNLMAQRRWRQRNRAMVKSNLHVRQPHLGTAEGSHNHQTQQSLSEHHDVDIVEDMTEDKIPTNISLPLDIMPQDMINSFPVHDLNDSITEPFRSNMNIQQLPCISNDLLGLTRPSTPLIRSWIEDTMMAQSRHTLDQFLNQPYDQHSTQLHRDLLSFQDAQGSVRDQIIKSLELAESLYKHGTMLRLIPINGLFQRYLADAKEQLLSTPTAHQDFR